MSAALRRLAAVLGVAVLLGFAAYLISFVYVLRTGARDERRPADAIVVLGAAQYDGHPSPVLQARLDHSLVLYEAGLAPLIVLTGGVGTGDTISEAMVGRHYLESRNVPDSALVVRPEGRSTGSSMNAVAAWLKRENLERIILVSDPFHMGRLKLEARRLDLNAYVSPTRTSPISGSLRGEMAYVAQEALKVPIAWLLSW